jgi:hypothetical protein
MLNLPPRMIFPAACHRLQAMLPHGVFWFSVGQLILAENTHSQFSIGPSSGFSQPGFGRDAQARQSRNKMESEKINASEATSSVIASLRNRHSDLDRISLVSDMTPERLSKDRKKQARIQRLIEIFQEKLMPYERLLQKEKKSIPKKSRQDFLTDTL